MPTLNSMAEILEECVKLTQRNEGWQYLPADDPEHASFGMVAFRRIGGKGEPLAGGQNPPDAREESVLYEWLPYGKRLESEVLIAKDATQFRMLVNDLRPKGIFRCDDPRKLLIGFVGYDGVKAHVVRFPLTRIKDADFDEAFHLEIQIGTALRMR